MPDDSPEHRVPPERFASFLDDPVANSNSDRIMDFLDTLEGSQNQHLLALLKAAWAVHGDRYGVDNAFTAEVDAIMEGAKEAIFQGRDEAPSRRTPYSLFMAGVRLAMVDVVEIEVIQKTIEEQ